MGDIVKYNNNLNTVSFGKFKEKELDLFFSLCFKAKEQGTNIIKIDFSELKSLSAYQNRNLKRFTEDLEGIYDKLLSLKMTERHSELSFTKFNLFNEYTVNAEERTITIQVHEKFKNFLNNLLENYTKFELENLVALKSSYSKNMFRLLKQWEGTKEKLFSIDELRNLLDIPAKYNTSRITAKILNPIKKELSSFFPDLNITPKKNGRTIIAYKFTWGAGKVDDEVIEYKEDDKKEIEVSKEVLDYIKNICKYNRFIKEVLDNEENLIKLIEKFQGKQVALVKGLEFCKKEIQKEINLTYLIKAIKSGAGLKRIKKVLKIVDDEVAVPKEVPTEQPAPTVPVEQPVVEVPKVEVEETNSELSEFEKLSREEQVKIEDIAIKLYKKDTGVQSNPVLNMRNTNIFKNTLKKYILQAMNEEEVPAEEKVEVEEQPIQVKEEKKVYTVEDIPADKLLTKTGKKLGGVALQARIEKILKEMNGE